MNKFIVRNQVLLSHYFFLKHIPTSKIISWIYKLGMNHHICMITGFIDYSSQTSPTHCEEACSLHKIYLLHTIPGDRSIF
jgi:hypothetical protein